MTTLQLLISGASLLNTKMAFGKGTALSIAM
jgi:hypothetical protein